MADRVVDEDPDELAQPARVAVERKRLGVHFDAHVAFDRERRKAAGGVERHLAQVRRLDRELEDARIGPRQEEQVVDEGPSRSVSASMSSRASPTSATGWSGWRRRCATEPFTTLSGVRSSWLASAANSRWRRIASRIGTRARSA